MGGGDVVRAGDRVIPTIVLKLWAKDMARGRMTTSNGNEGHKDDDSDVHGGY